MPKDTSRAKVMLNSEKIKPIALVVIELCLFEGIGRSVGRSVSRLVGRSVSRSVGQSVSQAVNQSVSRTFH